MAKIVHLFKSYHLIILFKLLEHWILAFILNQVRSDSEFIWKFNYLGPTCEPLAVAAACRAGITSPHHACHLPLLHRALSCAAAFNAPHHSLHAVISSSLDAPIRLQHRRSSSLSARLGKKIDCRPPPHRRTSAPSGAQNGCTPTFSSSPQHRFAHDPT
jgi:hypothetical protein